MARKLAPRFAQRVHASRRGSMVCAGSRFLAFAALAAALCAVPAVAQTGRISGVVRDAGGVAMSGATVRATNERTGASSRTTTAAVGGDTVASHAPGAYTVSASLPCRRQWSTAVQYRDR